MMDITQPLARMAEATALASIANTHTDVVTCAGCRVYLQNGNRADRNCERLRAARLCQRQVYERITMARLAVELVRELSRCGVEVLEGENEQS